MMENCVMTKGCILLAALCLVLILLLLYKNKKNKTVKKEADKFFNMFALTAQWIRNNQKGKSVGDYLLAKGYKRIGIYGVGYLGQLLCDELDGSLVEIIYAIDKSESVSLSNSTKRINVLRQADPRQQVDAIIVTAIQDYEGIKEKYRKSVECDIISLEQVIYEGAGI